MTSKKKLRKRAKAARQDGALEATQAGSRGDRAIGRCDAPGGAGTDSAPVPARETVARQAEPGPSGTDAVGRYNAILVETVRSNVAATSAFLTALVTAKSMPEAVALHADHLCRQIEALTDRGRDLADLTQTLARDALKPFTAAVDGDR